MEEVAQQSPTPIRLAGPWLRWAGGKRTLAPKLVVEILKTSPKLYIEPFLGGGAVALALPRELPKVLSDVNPHLIDCWLCMRNLAGTLYRELDDVVAGYGNGQTGYIKARDEFNRMSRNPRKMWARRSAIFMYLNARCFNGLWRTNSHGFFNVPFGKLDKPRSFHWDDDFTPAASALSHATIYNDHYALVLGRELGDRLKRPMKYGDVEGAKRCMENVAIYADPPYDGTFDGYAKDGFGEEDQRLLRDQLANCAAAGAAVWTSNSDTPLIRELYSGGWQIEDSAEQHSIGSKAERRGKRGCLLIRGGAARL